MTSTITLTENADKLFTHEEFIGVFARDQLPNKIENTEFTTCMIVNTDASNLPGTHWVAIVMRSGHGYYFDPFGYQPPLMINSWMNIHLFDWNYNIRQIQNIQSRECAYFCLHFCFAACTPMFKNVDLWKIIDHLYPKLLHYSHYEMIVDNFKNDQSLK